jgi:transposase
MFQLPAGGHLSLQQKSAIITLHERNVPKNDIALQMECHITTVRKWIRRYEETLDVHRKGGSGRPLKTTPAQDMRIFQAIRARPITSLQEIKGDYKSSSCNNYGDYTVATSPAILIFIA